MPSRYVLQVVEKGSGRIVASWPPGLREEQDVIAAIVDGVRAKGVGIFKTEAHVIEAVRSVVADALYQVKAQVKP